MKKVILLSLLILVSLSPILAQTIHVANNNPGATSGTNVFTGSTALQDAIDAATSGDIIHVIPSPTDYGDVTISDKSLSLVGIGLNPSTDLGIRSEVDEITVNYTGANGSSFSGLHLRSLLLAQGTAPTHTLSNILVENCEMARIIAPVSTSNSVGNLIVRNSIFNSSNSTGDGQAFELGTTSGVIISNNIIRGACCVHGAIEGDNLTIQNNLFFDNSSSGLAFMQNSNCVIQNNIFLNTTPGIGAGSGNSFLNNISYNTSDDVFGVGSNGNTGSGNIEAMDPTLTNLPLTGADNAWNYSYDITPLAGSPVLDAGSDGTDIGPTGGANPFDAEGTFLPLIESLTVPAIVTQGTDLNVNIKAKGN